VDLTPLTEDRKLTKLEETLASDLTMKNLKERAEIGCSIGTLATIAGVSAKVFEVWIVQGKIDSEKYDRDFGETNQMILWDIISKAWAQARTIAEARFAEKDPERFLQSKTSRMIGDDYVDRVDSTEEDTVFTKDLGANFVESLKILRDQGMDLNEIIDNDKLKIKTSAPERKKEDLLIEQGLKPPKRQSSLPSIFEEQASEIDESTVQ
jgi:hypothetical protein